MKRFVKCVILGIILLCALFTACGGGGTSSTEQDTVDTPTADPVSGVEVKPGDEITLNCGTEGAVIYYTWNGSNPNTSSSVYSDSDKPTVPDTDASAITLKVCAYKDGWDPSLVLTVIYRIYDPSMVHQPKADPATGPVAEGTYITLDCDTEGAIIYYTLDGDIPTSLSTKYTEDNKPQIVAGNTRLQAYAVLAGSGLLPSHVLDINYTLIPRQKAATPAAEPAGGAVKVASGQEITLSCDTPDTVIHYTLDGTEPMRGHGNTYTDSHKPQIMDNNTTLKAIAVKEFWDDSDVAVFTYNILGVAAPVAEPHSGVQLSGTLITLSSSTAGAAIIYTWDPAPAELNKTYSPAAKPVIPIGGGTLRAQAIANTGESTGLESSAIVLFTYTSDNKVTFDTDSGSTINDQFVSFGGKATRPAVNPTRDKYFFDNWYSDKSYSFEKIFDFNSVIEEDTTIYAHWVAAVDRMVWIPAGSFMMGSPTDEPGRNPDETQHKVSITRGFYMNKYQVTQKEFFGTVEYYKFDVLNSLGDYGNPGPAGGDGSDDFPVYNLQWVVAILYCNMLSTADKLDPVYYQGTTAIEYTPGDFSWAVSNTVRMDLTKNGYRLPTEAEWEYACRAGTTTAYNWGPVSDTSKGNYAEVNTENLEVGSYAPNAWGLYDMHGNVAEWCWDYYHNAYYNSGGMTDPAGPDTSSGDPDNDNRAARVLRGGSFAYTAAQSRSAARGLMDQEKGWKSVGFRIVRNIVN
ncbi:MAG: SUMF1/EgtB/PvdO family nonheme iron enzyme [Treponema sp.]|jgi:formylglycine-generating enzyme required for sulfatase activity|nr:SUMF1/EgtB/PvdO family nonheme iron enzyme [Treponema sp.]